MFNLQPPRHISTLPSSEELRVSKRVRITPITRPFFACARKFAEGQFRTHAPQHTTRTGRNDLTRAATGTRSELH
jgi:hypothetical protein